MLTLFTLAAAIAEPSAWIHLTTSSGELVLTTIDGRGPSTQAFDNTANTPKLRLSYVGEHITLQNSQEEYLTQTGEASLGFTKVAGPRSRFSLVRHYTGAVSFRSSDNLYLTVDSTGSIQLGQLEKSKSTQQFTVVELAKKLDAQVTTKPTLDCSGATIASIRKQYGGIAGSKKYPVEILDTTSSPGYFLESSQRIRDGKVIESRVQGSDESGGGDRYKYFDQNETVFFSYDIIEDYREDVRWEIRRYYQNGNPCRCLIREGNTLLADQEAKAKPTPAVDVQVSCSAERVK